MPERKHFFSGLLPVGGKEKVEMKNGCGNDNGTTGVRGSPRDPCVPKTKALQNERGCVA